MHAELDRCSWIQRKRRKKGAFPGLRAGNLSHSATSTSVNNAVARSRIELFRPVRRFQSMAACKNSAAIDLDYVDDSEPERKRIKLQAAETKKRRTHQKQLERRRETTVTIVARGSSPFSQIPTYPRPVDDNAISPGYFSLRLI
jgi:hypothetical protein